MNKGKSRSGRRRTVCLEFLEERNLLNTFPHARPAATHIQFMPHFVRMKGTIDGAVTLESRAFDSAHNVIVQVEGTGTGEISHLGSVTLTESHVTTLLAATGYSTSSATAGKATVTAANGEELFLEFSGSGVATQNGFDDTFHYTVTGGTGRFVDASGRGIIHSSDQPGGTPTQIPFHLTLEGFISSVGSSKK